MNVISNVRDIHVGPEQFQGFSSESSESSESDEHDHDPFKCRNSGHNHFNGYSSNFGQSVKHQKYHKKQYKNKGNISSLYHWF